MKFLRCLWINLMVWLSNITRRGQYIPARKPEWKWRKKR